MKNNINNNKNSIQSMSVKTGDRTDGGRGALVVQWLGLCAFTARGMGLIPGW